MADLWTRPTSTPYQFATDPGVRLEPIAGRKAQGWVPGEPVSALQANDLWGVASDWVVLLDAIAPADGTLAAQAVELYDTAATPALAATWTAGSVADSALLTVGAVGWEWQTTGMVGPKAIADAVYGARFQYDSTDLLTLDHDFSPSGGGYTPIVVNPFVGAGLPASLVKLTTSHLMFNPNAVAQDASFRRPLIISYDPASTGPALFPKLVSITATYVGATNDFKVRVIKILKSNGAETVLCTLDAATPTFTFAGTGEITDPQFKHYVVELYSAALGAGLTTADALRTVTLVADHGVLNPIL